MLDARYADLIKQILGSAVGGQRSLTQPVATPTYQKANEGLLGGFGGKWESGPAALDRFYGGPEDPSDLLRKPAPVPPDIANTNPGNWGIGEPWKSGPEPAPTQPAQGGPQDDYATMLKGLFSRLLSKLLFTTGQEAPTGRPGGDVMRRLSTWLPMGQGGQNGMR